MGFQPLSKPSLFSEVVGRDGAGEGSLCKVDELAAFSREVKIEDCLYSFSIFAGFCP